MKQTNVIQICDYFEKDAGTENSKTSYENYRALMLLQLLEEIMTDPTYVDQRLSLRNRSQAAKLIICELAEKITTETFIREN